jgi:hypothetical protein
MDYEGLKDEHLNTFFNYEGKPQLENNITKAFINTLESLTDQELREIFKDLFNVSLPNTDLKFDYYLQKKPAEKEIKDCPESHRHLFAFSPTGKCWEFGQALTEKEFEENIKKEMKERYPDDDEYKDNLQNALDEFKKGREGDSIPDGWILVYANGGEKPIEVIAMEDKLYDLDHYQLNNHLEKSLFIESNKDDLVFCPYSKIIDEFSKINSFMPAQFNEFMLLLGYKKIEPKDFKAACLIDNCVVKNKICSDLGPDIIKQLIPGDVDMRSKNICRGHVDLPYLKEVNLYFEENTVELHLSFGSMQNEAKTMLNTISPESFNSHDHLKIYSSFHLRYLRGRNISESYFLWQGDISGFVNYWKKHIDDIKLLKIPEGINLYHLILSDGYMKDDDFQKLIAYLSNKKNPVCVIPEITMNYFWTYKEVSDLGFDSFLNELKGGYEEALNTMKLK